MTGNYKTFMVYVIVLESIKLVMIIYSSQITEVIGDNFLQIATL